VKIACFYTLTYSECRDSLPPGTELVWTGYGDDAYWNELSTRWDGTGDLLVIEHDMQLHGQVVPQFEACPALWCTFGYEYGPRWPGHFIEDALGCTRFRAQLQQQFPLGMVAAHISATDGLPPVPFWHNCDLYIRRALTRAGLKPCVHEPPVTHLRGS